MVNFLKSIATLIGFIIASCSCLIAQVTECNYIITGTVCDKQHHTIPGAIIHLLNTNSGAASDTSGLFEISGVCSGKDTLVCEAVGYKPFRTEISVAENKYIQLTLTTDENQLGDIVVLSVREKQDIQTLAHTELHGLAFEKVRGLSLGEALKDLPGMAAFETGPTLSKPIIHGMYGNRILIMNDGVRQEGQQWGTEHAPEIDPFNADNITIIKGAASVRYGSDAVAGVLLINPAFMPEVPGINGNVYLIGETNGKMGILATTLEGAFKKVKGLSWRVQGTARKAGNFKAPYYYLANTGTQEGDFAADLEYRIKHFKFNLHYSEYNSEIGIFWGSQSGTIQDLLAAFNAPKPFSASYYTYNIARSYQTVSHDLLKASAEYYFDNGGKLELTFGLQKDLREEFSNDVLTNQAYNSPQLAFQLNTQTLDLVYTQVVHRGFSGSMGFTGSASGNQFQGDYYLIPNFRSYNGGIFAIEQYKVNKFTFEAGVRYDYRWLQVYQRNATTLQVYNVTYTYPANVTGTIGSSYHFNNRLSATMNVGTAWRAPSINEMYINGFHFSDGIWEKGDSTLKAEKALNTGLSVNYKSKAFRLSLDMYYNIINNYIFEQPDGPPHLFAGIAYPYFQYLQADATIKGIDLDWQWDATSHISLESKTSIVRGNNESIHNALIYMPSDRFQNAVAYHFNNLGKFNKPYVSVENVSVLKQNRVPPFIDYVAPPASYSLFNAHAGFFIPFQEKKSLNVDLSVNNLMNTAYRDYLDMFRYYCDALGINFTIRLKYTF